jgi:4-nitrophenyl phosphatase
MDAALLDVDGTVLRGEESIPGAREGLAALRERDLAVTFVTNNPTERPAAYAEKLSALGAPVAPDDVVTSMAATLSYLREHHPGATVLPIAGDAIVEQLREGGFEVVGDRAAADVVVAGYHEGFDHGDLTEGLRALRAGLPLVGTDPDRWVPTDDDPIPGSGAVVNAVAGAAEVAPEAVLGKPSAATADLLAERVGADPVDCLLVGDRLDTDVAMGERAGMETALVLTGAATRADVAEADVEPDHVLASLADVGDALD